MKLPFEVSVQDYAALRMTNHPPVLLDIRESDEFDTARISDSIFIPMGDIAEKISHALPEKDQHIVVHCHHGMRSARVVEYLQSLGYNRVQNLSGGIDAWSAEIDPSVPVY